MPVKSAKQFRFMHAVKSGAIPDVKPSIGAHFLEKTSSAVKSKFAEAYKKKKKK